MKVREITPSVHACGVGMCPGVYRTDRDTLLIVGTVRTTDEFPEAVRSRVAEHEGVVEIPIALIRDLTPSELK